MSGPLFLYLGPDKAGSTWLHEVLLHHPQVFVPDAKGLYFFDRYYERGLPWYLHQFDAACPQHLVRGEVCQDYLFHPLAADRMARCLGSVRAMVTLRDPAERAHSSYLHMLRSGWRAGSFLEALGRYPELLDHGRYATHLAPYLDRFGLRSLHVAVFDDLQADPQAFLDALTDWLGVDRLAMGPELLAPRLPAGTARSPAAARLVSLGAHLLRDRDGGGLVGRVKRVPVVQRMLYRPLESARPQMSADERAAVVAALADEVRRLDDVLGLDLARRWGWPNGRARDVPDIPIAP